MPSTVIRRFSYDADTRTLTVEFVSGVIYAYEAVPSELPERWRAAFSKGRFFAAHVRDHYACRRLDDATGRDPLLPWPEGRT